MYFNVSLFLSIIPVFFTSVLFAVAGKPPAEDTGSAVSLSDSSLDISEQAERPNAAPLVAPPGPRSAVRGVWTWYGPDFLPPDRGTEALELQVSFEAAGRWLYDQRITRTGNESTFEAMGRIRGKAAWKGYGTSLFFDIGLQTCIMDTARNIEQFDSDFVIIHQLFLRRASPWRPLSFDFGGRSRSWEHIFFTEVGPVDLANDLYAARTYRYTMGLWARYRRANGWLAAEAGLTVGEGLPYAPTRDTNSSKSIELLAGLLSPEKNFRFQAYLTKGDGIGSTPIKRRDATYGMVLTAKRGLFEIELTAFRYDHGYYETDVNILKDNGVPIPTSGSDQYIYCRGPFLQEDIDLDRPGRLWIGKGWHVRGKLGAWRLPGARERFLSMQVVYSMYDPDKDREVKNEFKRKSQVNTLVVFRDADGLMWYISHLVMQDPYFEQEFVGNNNYKIDLGVVMVF